MLAVLIQHAQSLKLKEIYAHYLPTKKNMPCLRFFQNSGFEQKEENTFVGKLEKSYVVPKVIKLENEVHFL